MGLMNVRKKFSMTTGAALLGVLIAPLASYAQSFTGELDGTNYDFSIVGPGSFVSLQETIEATPWWGNAALAENAANLVGDGLGLIDFEAGPLFAYGVADGEFPSLLAYAYAPWEEGAVFLDYVSTQVNHT